MDLVSWYHLVSAAE